MKQTAVRSTLSRGEIFWLKLVVTGTCVIIKMVKKLLKKEKEKQSIGNSTEVCSVGTGISDSKP